MTSLDEENEIHNDPELQQIMMNANIPTPGPEGQMKNQTVAHIMKLNTVHSTRRVSNYMQNSNAAN